MYVWKREETGRGEHLSAVLVEARRGCQTFWSYRQLQVPDRGPRTELRAQSNLNNWNISLGPKPPFSSTAHILLCYFHHSLLLLGSLIIHIFNNVHTQFIILSTSFHYLVFCSHVVYSVLSTMDLNTMYYQTLFLPPLIRVVTLFYLFLFWCSNYFQILLLRHVHSYIPTFLFALPPFKHIYVAYSEKNLTVFLMQTHVLFSVTKMLFLQCPQCLPICSFLLSDKYVLDSPFITNRTWPL